MEPFILKKAENGVSYFHIPALEEEMKVKTFFTSRNGGVSQNEFTSLNFGGYTNDDPSCVKENRRLVLEALGVNHYTEAFSRQVHGNKVACIQRKDICSEETLTINNVDGMVTNVEEILTVTLHADCLPLFFVDGISKTVAVAHAGWRGTQKNIAKCTIDKMTEAFGAKAENVKVAIGPGISQCCFETGLEVYEAFAESFQEIDQCAIKKDNGKYMIDLKKINQIQLEYAGVRQVYVSGYCTKCHSDLFFSHRRDHGKTGRMGAGMIIGGE